MLGQKPTLSVGWFVFAPKGSAEGLAVRVRFCVGSGATITVAVAAADAFPSATATKYVVVVVKAPGQLKC